MLINLDIKNIALIEHVNFELSEGLNILTGETGAGKSIIIDSIKAVIGGRISKEIIRTGKDKAYVEAAFFCERDDIWNILKEVGIDREGESTLFLSREFGQNGKNICRINGKMVTMSVLKEVGEMLIDIHGQHDQQSLLKQDSHIELLDMYAGEEIKHVLEKYIIVYQAQKEIASKLEKLTGDPSERERKIDILQFQIEEIEEAALKSGEDIEIEKKRQILINSEKIARALNTSYAYLSGGSKMRGAVEFLDNAATQLELSSEFNSEYKAVAESLRDIHYRAEDILREVRNFKDDFSYSEDDLEKLDERADIIFKIKKKYGGSVESALFFCKNAKNELEELLGSAQEVENLLIKQDKLFEEMYTLSDEITKLREKSARKLEKLIKEELNDLEMKNTYFNVNIENLFNEQIPKSQLSFNKKGLNRVEFLFSANKGEALKSLSKIASGGEMARVMLAIKNILATIDKVGTMIFDEIDTGISGVAAQKVGQKLMNISGEHQVICVTHHAIIASMAKTHFFIMKKTEKNETKTYIKQMNEKERINEIARILGGQNVTEITIKHAKQLLGL